MKLSFTLWDTITNNIGSNNILKYYIRVVITDTEDVGVFVNGGIYDSGNAKKCENTNKVWVNANVSGVYTGWNNIDKELHIQILWI